MFRAHGGVWHAHDPVAVVFAQWRVVSELLSVQRRMRDTAKAQKEAREDKLSGELGEAYKRGDLARSWRLDRRLAGLGPGPRGRARQAFQYHVPKTQDWEEFLARPGCEGGMAAQKVQAEGPAGVHYNYPGGNVVCEQLMEYRDFVEVLKRAANRKAPCDGDMPGEVWKMAVDEVGPHMQRGGVGD